MSRLFFGSSIPDWVLEATSCQLFQTSLERKETIIKRAIFATNKLLFDSDGNNLEVLLTEISDGHYYVPALIIPEVVRLGLSLDRNESFNCHDLIGKVLEVKEYMIAAYRINKTVYPYIIILQLDSKEKGPTQSMDSTVEDVCDHTEVKEWIRLFTSKLSGSEETVSSFFKAEEVARKCLDIQTYEPIVEMILSTLYRNRILTSPISANQTSHPTNKSNDQQLRDTISSTRPKDLTESRKRIASGINSQGTLKRVKIGESSATTPTDIPTDFDKQCQKSILAEFDAMSFILDEHVLPYTTSSITCSPKPSPNMDLDVLPKQPQTIAVEVLPTRNTKEPSPTLPPPCSTPSTIEDSPVNTYQLMAQPAGLANSLNAPSKFLTARQRRLAFEKIRRESLLEFLHF